MSRSHPCHHRILAASSVCRVRLCEHETVHLDVGALTLRLSPDQLEAVANTLAAASAELACAAAGSQHRVLC